MEWSLVVRPAPGPDLLGCAGSSEGAPAEEGVTSIAVVKVGGARLRGLEVLTRTVLLLLFEPVQLSLSIGLSLALRGLHETTVCIQSCTHGWSGCTHPLPGEGRCSHVQIPDL